MSDHILVIHRWRDRHALYADYVDHDSHRVCYITTELARTSVPTSAAAVAVVGATDDLEQVSAAAQVLASRFGPPARVVALNEGDLDTAAALRQRIGCQGDNPARLARFRDKLVMARAIERAAIPIPRFADAPDAAAVAAFADQHGWPVIVKPRRGTASRAVLRLDSARDLPKLDGLAPEDRLVQVFCPDPICHIDGLWTGSRLGPWRASRYVNTCVGFTTGETLGSVEIDDQALLGPLGEFVATVAGALSDRPWVFHLEVFVGTRADGAPRLTFLEVGARVGGAEIPFLWREVHGVDLMAAAVDIQLGRVPELAVPARWQTGGWLLVPSPARTPCRVLAAQLTVSADSGPYAEVLPLVGQVIPRVGGYEHVGARFRFRGTCTNDVEKAIMATAAHFWLECEAI